MTKGHDKSILDKLQKKLGLPCEPSLLFKQKTSIDEQGLKVTSLEVQPPDETQRHDLAEYDVYQSQRGVLPGVIVNGIEADETTIFAYCPKCELSFRGPLSTL